jgi:hypothetical protein
MQLVRRGGGSDRHALKLRDLALRLVSAQRPSYRDEFLIIEYRPQVDDLPNGLDIWQRDDIGRKMLSMFWTGDRRRFV